MIPDKKLNELGFWALSKCPNLDSERDWEKIELLIDLVSEYKKLRDDKQSSI